MNNDDFDIESGAARYDNFLGLPPRYSECEQPAFRLFTAPYERSTSYGRGAGAGPGALIEASWQVETYDCEIDRSAYKLGIATDRSLDGYCCGGFGVFFEAAREAVGDAIDSGAVPVMIGGEHTITRAGAAAALRRFPDLTVVQLDAHADLRDSYCGDPDSHASVMRRVLELGADQPRLVEVGIRSMCLSEKEFADSRNRICIYPARAILERKITAGDALSGISGEVYLTVDLDALDPSEMPGVGTPEPGGLSWLWVTDFIARLSRRARIVAYDVVELCPIEGQMMSQFIAAKLTYRIMGLIAESEGL